MSYNQQISTTETAINCVGAFKRRWNVLMDRQTEKTLELNCDMNINEIDDAHKQEILSEIYRYFSVSNKINNEYNCDMAETMTKIIEIILENHSEPRTRFIAIVNDRHEIILEITSSCRPSGSHLAIYVAFDFGIGLIKLIENYEMKTKISKDVFSTKSARNI